jgi:hypothetical protein
MGQSNCSKHAPSSVDPSSLLATTPRRRSSALDFLLWPSSQCVLIGDSVTDIQVSHLTGVRSIGNAKHPARGPELGSGRRATSRIIVTTTAVEVRGKVTLGHEPKTKRSKRTIPMARSVMRRIEQHLATYVDAGPDALVFTGARGGPLFHSTFGRHVWKPAIAEPDYKASRSTACGTVSSRSWWRPAATSARSRSGRSQQRRLHAHALRRPVRGRVG